MKRVCLSERSAYSGNVLRKVLRKSNIFQHFLFIFFPSVNCTHSGEGMQKAIYADRYHIALPWRGPSPSESVSVWEGGDACKSAWNRKSTEQSDFFLIRMKQNTSLHLECFHVVFLKVLEYINTILPGYYLYFRLFYSFIGCIINMVILQKSIKHWHPVTSGILLLGNKFYIPENWLWGRMSYVYQMGQWIKKRTGGERTHNY